MKKIISLINNGIRSEQYEVYQKKLAEISDEYTTKGDIDKAARADKGRILLNRIISFREKRISDYDFLMYLRDVIIILGNLGNMPSYIIDTVKKYGNKFGLYISENNITVDDIYPDWMDDDERKMVESVYAFKLNNNEKDDYVAGDNLLDSIIFDTYKSKMQKMAVHLSAKLPDGHNLMVVLPTGGGKSIITQVLSTAEDKLTLIIVPTVALADDQLIQAKKCLKEEAYKGRVFKYSGNISPAEKNIIYKALQNRKACMLITSPEAIMLNHRLHKLIESAIKTSYLHNIVIDEAHIVEEWGNHFRPEFQILSIIVQKWRNWSNNYLRIYLLSATLPELTTKTLFELFGEDGKNVQYRCDALRKEPRFILKNEKDIEKRIYHVLEAIKKLPKPLILYVISPDEADMYYHRLLNEGFGNIFTYTGKTPNDERENYLKKWKENDVDVIIATSAFGMGVDKSNVRTIVHACAPETLNRFYQEIGRAGRDGLPSLSLFIPYTGKNDNSDLSISHSLISKSTLTTNIIAKRFYSLVDKSSIEGDVYTSDLSTPPEYFTEEEKMNVGKYNMGWNINLLLMLHRLNFVEIIDVYHQNDKYYFKYKINDFSILDQYDVFFNQLNPYRDEEAHNRKIGYEQIRKLIYHGTNKCWGYHFKKIFEHVNIRCNGCPGHKRKRKYISENISEIKVISDEITITPENDHNLRKYFGGYEYMVINDSDMCFLDNIRTINMSCIIVPDNYELPKYINTKSFIITISDFCKMYSDISWIFTKGIIAVFSDEESLNDKLFRAISDMKLKYIPKVLVCSENEYIPSEGKSIRNFLDYSYIDYKQLC